MPGTRDDGRFEVPVRRLDGGRDQTRRATAVAIALVAVVGVAFGLARWSEGTAGTPTASATARLAVASAAPSASLAPPSRRPASPRVETLLPIDRVPLAGSPELTLTEVTGDDQANLGLVVWTPDDGRIRRVGTIPNVLPPRLARPTIPVVSPDRNGLLVFELRPGMGEDTGKLYDRRGRLLWRGEHLTGASGAVWSPDGRHVVTSGQPRAWHLVTIDRPGHAASREVTLPGEVYLPSPIPPGSINLPTLEPRTVPLGFSEDGAWIYGGVISPELGVLIGKFRVSSDGRTVERLLDFGVGRPDGLAPRAGTQGTRTVDPVDGRIATSRINSDTTGGPWTVDVRGTDSSFLFSLDAGVTLGAEWDGTGDLVALSADAQVFPETIELRRFGPEGRSGPAILTTGPLTAGVLVGVRDGYAVVGLLASDPTPGGQIVVVDLAHPERMTALPVDAETLYVSASLDR